MIWNADDAFTLAVTKTALQKGGIRGRAGIMGMEVLGLAEALNYHSQQACW